MITILLVLIGVMLWLFSCALCAVGGFFFAKRHTVVKHSALSKEGDSIAAKKAQHEYNNFLNYTGDEMPEFKL